MKLFKTCSIFLAAATSSLAMAAEPGWYLGAGIGYADVVSDDDEDNIAAFLNQNGLTATLDNDTKNFNFRIGGGYWFTDRVGFEVNYLTLGEVDVDANITAPTAGMISTDSDLKAVELVVQYAFPISNRFEIVAKGGAIAWDGEVDVNFSGSAAGVGTISSEKDGTDFTVGIGYTRSFKNKSWLWRGGYQYLDVDRVEHLFSTGVVYRFGQ